MKYQKPEVAVLDSAYDAIQATSKNGQNLDLPHHPTIPAYEADE